MTSPATAAVPATAIAIDQTFEALEKQRELITTCTQLWKDLSAHFSTLDQRIQAKSESLRSKRHSLDASTRRTLDSLHRRELTIEASVDLVVSRVDELAARAAAVVKEGEETSDLVKKVRVLCARMDFEGFLDLVLEKRKDGEVLWAEMPVALGECVDPGNFVLDVISKIFPVDKREVKVPSEVGWVCVLILESLVPVLADPEIGSDRMLVTRCVKDRAKEMAEEWKGKVKKMGGIESVKPMDGHAFLQLVVTFGIVDKEDGDLYKRIVICFAWRKHMPKLAMSLGLRDQMEDIVEELINKHHQLDAINFVYEAGLQEKFPPIPLVKSFLKDSKKEATVSVEDADNSGQAVSNNNRKEQSAIRYAMKCIQDHKLEADFPLENLQKRLEQLEKGKQDKKRPSVSGPAAKRTRASNGGPMPPAKAGRLTNNAYVSSFPAAPAFVRSPSAHAEYSAASPYAYDRPVGHGVYGSRSPPAMREPYPYPAVEVAPAAIGSPYHSPPMSYPATPPMNYPASPPMSYPATPPMSYPAAPPMSYPAYGSYNNAMGGYNNGMTPPGYQQAYYR